MEAFTIDNDDDRAVDRDAGLGPVEVLGLALQEAKRIRLEALRAGEASHDALIADAERTCREMIEAARQEAARIVEAARLEATRTKALMLASSADGEPGAGSVSAQTVLEVALEESRQVRLAAVREAQSLREGLLSAARREANEIVRHGQERAGEVVAHARTDLMAVGDEMHRLQETFSFLTRRLDGYAEPRSTIGDGLAEAGEDEPTTPLAFPVDEPCDPPLRGSPSESPPEGEEDPIADDGDGLMLDEAADIVSPAEAEVMPPDAAEAAQTEDEDPPSPACATDVPAQAPAPEDPGLQADQPSKARVTGIRGLLATMQHT